jgi:hypothetical protein
MVPLHIHAGYTLIDISDTGVITVDDSPRRNQHRNWETLVQVLGLRAQLMLLSSPEVMELDVSKLEFGEDFTGKQLVWVFKFGVEQEDVYANANTAYGNLESDCSCVPVIIGLNETAKITVPTFCTMGNQKNIYFNKVKI